MILKKQIVRNIILFTLLVILTVSCNSNNDGNVNELKNQVSALQTQNALLQESLASPDNHVEAPPPPGQSTEAELIEKTPTVESLPSSPVPAGQPIIYNGWSITVSKELNINSYDDIWGINIFIRNLGETSRIFRFMNSAITATDDLGNVFEPSTLCPYMGCLSCEAYYYQVKNLKIDGLKSMVISSGTNGNGCMNEDGIGMFKGPISLGAKQLIIHFSDFGPFSDVDVVIEL